MTALSDYSTYVRPYLDGCPDIYIERAVMEAAIEICESSFLWRDESGPHAVVAGVREYDLYPEEEDAEVDHLEAVSLNGKNLVPTSLEHLVQTDPNYHKTEGSPSRYYHVNSHVTIAFDRIPNKTSPTGMKALFVLKPKRTATTLPDFLFNDWLKAIINGALASLYRVPGKEWSNPELGMVKRQEFATDKANARIHVNNQWSDRPLKARGRRVLSRKRAVR